MGHNHTNEINKEIDNRKLNSQADNSTTDAPSDVSASYTEAEVQAIADLANALKSDFNALLQKLRDADLME